MRWQGMMRRSPSKSSNTFVHDRPHLDGRVCSPDLSCGFLVSISRPWIYGEQNTLRNGGVCQPASPPRGTVRRNSHKRSCWAATWKYYLAHRRACKILLLSVNLEIGSRSLRKDHIKHVRIEYFQVWLSRAQFQTADELVRARHSGLDNFSALSSPDNLAPKSAAEANPKPQKLRTLRPYRPR